MAREYQTRWVLILAGLMALWGIGTNSLAQDQTGDGATESADGQAETEEVAAPEELNLFKLILKGGWFMVPIGIMSLVVVTFVIERAFGLRRSRIVPRQLVEGLGDLGRKKNAFDPRVAYRLCQQYPSAAASVIRAMLLKVGRPHSEVEHTVMEASQREADRVHANCRWLNLAAAVTPLIGLTGTVWGMINAFHRTTILDAGQSKAEYLAEGIYLALVTTLGGLFVAIPAAIFAHYFEGRVQKLFHEVDELLFSLMPHIERFEGRVRFGRQIDMTDSLIDAQQVPEVEAQPPAPTSPPASSTP